MKKVLILVISADVHPYEEMINTSLKTWDSIEVPNCETIFYCGQSNKKDTDKVIYLPIKDGLFQMGYKTILALEWALRNKEFDYIARVNSSCYVRKDLLVDHCQALPTENLMQGLVTESCYGIDYCWGGGQYIISRDLVKQVVTHKSLWNHKIIEDVSISDLITRIGVPLNGDGNAYSINKTDNGWSAFVYGVGENMEFTDFSDLKQLESQYFIRVKQDGNRPMDKIVMENLYGAFN